MHEYEAKVVAVHDGDTFKVRIDLGFDIWMDQDVRLEGIDTPELSKLVDGKRVLIPAGESATIALLNLLGRQHFAVTRTRPVFGIPGDYLALPGQEPEVIIKTRLLKKLKDTEKYGRVLGAVRETEQSTITYNRMMLDSGFAVEKYL